MSGECDKCGEHCLDCRCDEYPLDAHALIKKAYDKQGVKYSIYEGNNRFYGIPVPEGYEAVYIKDDIFPGSLQLKKIDIK